MKVRSILKSGVFGLIFMIFVGFVVNFWIIRESSDYIFYNVEDAVFVEGERVDAALVLGAMVYSNGQMSDIFADRVKSGLELYEAGVVEKILVSGDHGREHYDEVSAARDFLLANGVRGEDIFLDHAGFDTYDSIYRASEIFELESVIVVTQEFHLSRGVYVARRLGMDAYGYVADRQKYVMQRWNETREVLARGKAFFDVLVVAESKFSGDVISIKGDGRESWD